MRQFLFRSITDNRSTRFCLFSTHRETRPRNSFSNPSVSGNPHWIAGYWGFVRTGMETAFSVYMNREESRRWLEERLAQEKLARWQQKLRAKGVEVEITVCRDRTRSVIKSAKRDGRVKLIMTPIMSASPLRRLIGRLTHALGLFGIGG